MATVVKQRVGRREVGIVSPARSRRVGWVVGALAVLALAAVAAAATMMVSRGPNLTVGDARSVSSLYTESELAVMRLAAKGYIPSETLDGEPYRTKALINQGLIPRETLGRWVAPIEPLYCPQELELMEAVANGLVPKSVLEEEPFRTKSLINQGLIPRAAAGPC